jgi:hypothetical protein
MAEGVAHAGGIGAVEQVGERLYLLGASLDRAPQLPLGRAIRNNSTAPNARSWNAIPSDAPST